MITHTGESFRVEVGTVGGKPQIDPSDGTHVTEPTHSQNKRYKGCIETARKLSQVIWEGEPRLSVTGAVVSQGSTMLSAKNVVGDLARHKRHEEYSFFSVRKNR